MIKRPLFFYEGEGTASGAAGGAAANSSGAGVAAGANTLLAGAGAGANAGAGAGTGASATPGFIKDDGSFSPNWLEKLPEDIRGSDSLKTIQSLPDLAKNYIETKKLVGKKFEMPGEGATPEQIAFFRKVTGAPEKPEGYLGDAKTLRPDSIPESAWDAEGEKQFLTVAHKHHLSPAAVKDIIALHGAQISGAIKMSEEQQTAALQAEGNKLRTAWGRDYDANVILASRVAQTVGLDPKTHEAFRSAEMVQTFAKIGKLLSEDKLVRGEQGSGINATIQDRIREITDLKSTSVMARDYRGENGPERQQAAQAQLHELYKSAQQAA